MRVYTRMFVLFAAAAACLIFAGTPAMAQNQEINGKIVEAGTNKPIMGATIDLYRTDQEDNMQAKTDAGGKFSLSVPKAGTYILVVSAPNRGPKIMPDVKPSGPLPSLDFALDPGNGARPSRSDAKAMISGGPTDAEKAEYEKQLKLKAEFDTKRDRFDAGIKAVQAKDYPTAITSLTSSLEGLDANSDMTYWGELINAAGGNLAEVHYRVAVDRFNSGNRDEAKTHLERGSKVIALAIKANPTAPVNYAIQGKTLLLLVDKFGMADETETGAAAFLKAAEYETTDKKEQVDFIVKAGDVYRAGAMVDKAIETYKRALVADPDNVNAMYGIGLAAVSTSDEAQMKAMYQMAADYLKAFSDKAGADPRANEAKAVLATLASDFKIKPRPLK
jgi:tetratricopeptide (TPR) repeat protein